MRVYGLPIWLSLCLSLCLVTPALGQDGRGCCQFLARASAGNAARVRRCDNLTPAECIIRPVSSFLKELQCDFATGRCVRNAPLPPATQTPTLTPTRTATPTSTPTTPPQKGCCQLDNISGVHNPVCGNQVTETSCLNDFQGNASFCANCICSSHRAPGFDLSAGLCVPVTGTPTATPTPVGRTGCCQLDNVHRLRQPVCGNQINEVSCLNDFGGEPSFCPDCTCTSHSSSGFEFTTGVCAPPTATRNPTPTKTPTPSMRGCCQLSRSSGLSHSICGNDIEQSSCLNDFGGAPVFCANCRCTSHLGAGFDLSAGVCAQRHQVNQPHRPHHL